MLLDAYMPEYDVSERHHTRVAASRERPTRALDGEPRDAPVARMLLALRALPGALAHGVSGVRTLWERGSEPIHAGDVPGRGFRVLASCRRPSW